MQTKNKEKLDRIPEGKSFFIRFRCLNCDNVFNHPIEKDEDFNNEITCSCNKMGKFKIISLYSFTKKEND